MQALSESLDLELPAEPESVAEARHAAARLARHHGAEEADVKIAVSEAVGNAVLHAYPDAVGDIDLTVDYDNGDISIAVSDTGVGINRPTQAAGLGLGLQLIGALTTTWTVDSDAAGTTVTMRFNSNVEPASPEHSPDVHDDPETPV